MTHKQQLIKEARENYIKKFGLCDMEGMNCGCDKEIKFIEKLVSTTYDQAYGSGREDFAGEILHEQKKFTDGFSHPKDCEQCKRLPASPNNQ